MYYTLCDKIKKMNDPMIQYKLDTYDYEFVKNLVILANSDESDKLIKEQVVDIFNHYGLFVLISRYIDIYNWPGIIKLAKNDQRYVYVLLCCYKKSVKELDLLKKIVPNVITQAKGGNALAQNNLGYLYDSGIVVKQSSIKSNKYYKKAADQNLSQGLYNYGVINKFKNEKEFIIYMKAAQNVFSPIACYQLGMHYLSKNNKKEKGIKYYKESAQNHYASSQEFLGDYYEKINIDECIFWYKLAAKQFNTRCIKRLILIYSKIKPNPEEYNYWFLKDKKMKNQENNSKLDKNNTCINFKNKPIKSIKNIEIIL
ncbi:hypothetical protein QJ854_gp018 [Moumouvirus goulette]|uniref:Repeat protein n=1 Tax=Moumouvirus goulette TaxID=1247379 RepID=M1PCN4_9VIRU|nr:hypothetical protein QJ854_gp018 [Moumouvirus goulette]AGF85764.1 hypothetical protein glt_00961 [Moumouvirus goulette]